MAKGKWFQQLDGDTLLVEAATVVLQARLAVVEAQLPLAAGHGLAVPEHVHQLRVATRRAAAALRVFWPCLRLKDARRLRRALRRLRRAAAQARDIDVHREMLAASQDTLGSTSFGWHAQLDELLLRRRLKAQRRLCRTAEKHSPRLGRLATRAIERMGQDGVVDSNSPLDDLRARELAGRWEAVRQASAVGLDDLKVMHRLRIEIKHLRYAMEIFAGCYGPQFTEELYPQVEAVQSRLGEINDWNTWLADMDTSCRRLRRRLNRSGRRQFDRWVKELKHHGTARLERCRREFLDFWGRWSGEGFQQCPEGMRGIHLSENV